MNRNSVLRKGRRGNIFSKERKFTLSKERKLAYATAHAAHMHAHTQRISRVGDRVSDISQTHILCPASRNLEA